MRVLDETFGAENWQRSHEVVNGDRLVKDLKERVSTGHWLGL